MRALPSREMALHSGSPYERDEVRIDAPDPTVIRASPVDPDVAASVEHWLSRAETDSSVHYFAVFKGKTPVGQVLLHDIDHHTGEALVAYHLFEQRVRGRGIGTTMLRLLQRYVLDETTLKRLVVITDESNVASQRIALKCGFAFAGRPREDTEHGVIFEWRVSTLVSEDQAAAITAEPPDWIERAVAVESVTVDVAFVLSETLYFGPPNSVSGEEWRTMQAPIHQPAVPRHGSYALTTDLAEAPAELIAYYADVFRQAVTHRVELKHGHPAFWMRPVLFTTEDRVIHFAWHDTLSEARRFLQALCSSADDTLFDDVEQHWGLHVWARGDTLYFRYYDFDSDEDHPGGVIHTSRAAVQHQAQIALARATELVHMLVAHFGVDYWS